MFASIKRKIKLIKTSALIFGIIFALMFISNIFLIIKVCNLSEKTNKIEKELNGFRNILHFNE